MLGMVVGNQATKTQAEMFDKLGFSTTELAKRMQVDAKGAILDVWVPFRNYRKMNRPPL